VDRIEGSGVGTGLDPGIKHRVHLAEMNKS